MVWWWIFIIPILIAIVGGLCFFLYRVCGSPPKPPNEYPFQRRPSRDHTGENGDISRSHFHADSFPYDDSFGTSEPSEMHSGDYNINHSTCHSGDTHGVTYVHGSHSGGGSSGGGCDSGGGFGTGGGFDSGGGGYDSGGGGDSGGGCSGGDGGGGGGGD